MCHLAEKLDAPGLQGAVQRLLDRQRLTVLPEPLEENRKPLAMSMQAFGLKNPVASVSQAQQGTASSDQHLRRECIYGYSLLQYSQGLDEN